MNTIEKLMKSLIFMLPLFVLSFNSYSQSFRLEDLSGKTWNLQGLENGNYEERYEKDKIILYQNGNYLGTMEYYLTDSDDLKFKQSKVGKRKVGKYIIRRPIQDKVNKKPPLTVKIYEILELDTQNLILMNSKQQKLHFVTN